MAGVTLVLVGPMTGIEDFNRPAFNVAAEILRAAGYQVLNPAEYPEQPSWEHYLRQSITKLLTSDGIATLDGYSMSTGSRLELHVSRRLGIPDFSVHAWIDRARFVLRASTGGTA